jgi:hypothetical protein
MMAAQRARVHLVITGILRLLFVCRRTLSSCPIEERGGSVSI